MLLSSRDTQLFFKRQISLLYFVNQRLKIVPNAVTASDFADLSDADKLRIRSEMSEQLGTIELFVEENPARLNKDELEIVLSWRHQVSGQFYLFRQLKNHMVVLTTTEPQVAYGVVALSDPFAEVIGTDLPQLVEMVLLPFKGRIIYDGMLQGYNISFGAGIKRMLNDGYRRAKERYGIVTALPHDPTPLPPNKGPSTNRRKSKETTSSLKDVKHVLDEVAGITDEFCRQHLNDEYAELCRKMAETLSRKRPSPLLKGRPKTWACGIIRTIGMVNFLDDRSTQPHIKLTTIDKALGVGESTGQGKSMEIRKMLRIGRLDLKWTLPSQMDDNPLVWMVEVNGFPRDVRHSPRDIQEIAFQKGLIPYIPADRKPH